MPFQLLVFDEDRNNLEKMLASLPEDCRAILFSNHRAALRQIESRLKYDLVVVGLGNKNTHGESLLYDIKYIKPDQKVVAISDDFSDFSPPGIADLHYMHRPADLARIADQHLRNNGVVTRGWLRPKNKRRHDRAQTNIPAIIRINDTNLRCRITSLSEGGAFVNLRQIARPLTPIQVEVILRNQLLKLDGRVIYNRTYRTGPTPGVGVRFETVEEVQLDTLRDYIDKWSA